MTEELATLIYSYGAEIKANKIGLCIELYFLFSELAGRINNRDIRVNYLKSLGPDLFKVSTTQEDAQQYLTYLFEAIQNEIKCNSKLLENFHSIFKLEYLNTIDCEACGHQIQNASNAYIHTISHRQNFQLVTVESLENYQCGKCHSIKDSKITRAMKSKPKILIIHINRFSFHEGKARKQLANKPIRRKIGQFCLVGFICHRGKDMQRGHYIYYAKVGRLRWALMNDRRVTEFDLGEEEEEFEREMRAETTPYILFYRLLSEGGQ